MSGDWSYEIFISYTREDVAWAELLHAALKAADPKRKIFFDQQSLRAGDDWEARLDHALSMSRHLVVLWSDHAQQSDWVKREIFSFMAVAKPFANMDRRLICLNLKGDNSATKRFQNINHSRVQAEYLQSAPPIVASTAWTQAVQEVENGLDPDRRLLEVPLVVLTLTRGELDRIDANSLIAISEDLGLDKDALLARYGDTRRDWCPFDGADTIETLMSNIRMRLGVGLPGLAPVWRLPPDEFWTDVLAAQDYFDNNFKLAELSVLIVDPVALLHEASYRRLMLFQDRLNDSRTTILTLPPFASPVHILKLRNALNKHGKPYFNDYFKSSAPPHRRVAAQCGWNVSDSDEMRRLILAAADVQEFGKARQSDMASPFVRQ